jgi:condensin complex subunit 3
VLLEHYWSELTPESALLVRVFVDHCLNIGNDRCLETASIPVVTAIAFHVQETYNALLGLMQEEEEAKMLGDDGKDNEESDQREEDMAKKELVLCELLRMAVKLDYADEIGRRKMFGVIRE